MPITPLEAMHARLPVILARDGGIQEIVEPSSTALTFERDNSEALADAIEAFLDLSDCGREMAEICIMKLQADESFTSYIQFVEELMKASHDVIKPSILCPQYQPSV
jgi:glycosyltransferase involved in cell wall biosynthesis